MDSSARSLLLTVLGDFVLPSGGSAWLQTLSAAADDLDISSDATRRALRRLDAQGMVTVHHEGRLFTGPEPRQLHPILAGRDQTITTGLRHGIGNPLGQRWPITNVIRQAHCEQGLGPQELLRAPLETIRTGQT